MSDTTKTGIKIMRMHARHAIVVDTSKVGHPKLFEAVQPFGAEHAAAIKGTTIFNPVEKCVAWLKENGYQLNTQDEWVKMKKVVVRWTATYETTLDVPEDADLNGELVKDEAANINLDVNGSTYQTDTWNVDSITDANDPIHH